MLLAQAEELQLLPDTAELVWAVVGFALIVAVLVAVVLLLVRNAAGGRQQERRLKRLEERLDRLEHDKQRGTD
jgi:uncharacterized membrane-anchored protein YhcB (DUF1043 family)